MAGISDPVASAIVAGVFLVLAAMIAARVQHALKRNDAASGALTAHLGSWKDLATQLREYADDLRDEMREAARDCERRLDEMRQELQEMRQRDEECRRRLADLERRLSK